MTCDLVSGDGLASILFNFYSDLLGTERVRPCTLNLEALEVSWQFLLEILRAWGFGQRWRGWISPLLSTASTKVLLNGQPGLPIQHRRGLRQGDPLSPMLFVIVMDALNRLFIKAKMDNVLQPIGVPAIQHHCSLYADDAILLQTPTASEALAVKNILQMFGDASGLVTNVDKCSITPIFGDQAAFLQTSMRYFPAP